MELIGQTRDDAVGEAFDKAAKMLGLPYPGGPLIDKYAQSGNPKRFPFPATSLPGLDFSFSGIKTAFLYFLRRPDKTEPFIRRAKPSGYLRQLQFTLVKMLLDKVKSAVEQTGVNSIAIAGGVSANTGLQAETKSWEAKKDGRSLSLNFNIVQTMPP